MAAIIPLVFRPVQALSSESQNAGWRLQPDEAGDQARSRTVAQVKIEDGIIKVTELDVQDAKAAAVLAEYPEVRWPEITRRALKIGLGYLKGGAQD